MLLGGGRVVLVGVGVVLMHYENGSLIRGLGMELAFCDIDWR